MVDGSICFNKYGSRSEPFRPKNGFSGSGSGYETLQKTIKKILSTIFAMASSARNSSYKLGSLRQPECEPRGQLHRRNHPGREKLHPAAAPRVRHRGVRAGGEQPARDCAAPVRVRVQRGRTGRLRHLHRGGIYKNVHTFMICFSTYPVAKGQYHEMDILRSKHFNQYFLCMC